MPSLGEMAALTQLYEEHSPRLLSMLRRRIDPALAVRLDAEDLLAEVYLEARRRWPAYRNQTELSGYVWLYGIARDCLIEAWRKHDRACRSLQRECPWPEQSSVQLGLGLVQDCTGPRTAAEQAEFTDRMQQTIAQLQHSDRDILWMRHYDELSFADIAMLLNISENTATVRYIRALRRLKNLWLQACGPAA